jgi:hypothetical protein
VEVKNIVFIITGLLCGHLTTTAQNLVPNNSFEEMTLCPGNFTLNEMQTIKGWWQGSEGTPDYFNVCSTKAGVPENMFGSQLAKEGNAYAGLVLYSISNGTTYREYIQTKLTRPLAAGEMVCVEFYYSAAERCSYVVDGLGTVRRK